MGIIGPEAHLQETERIRGLAPLAEELMQGCAAILDGGVPSGQTAEGTELRGAPCDL